MTAKDLEEAFRLIDSSEKSDFRGPQSESLIAHAENALGISFPPTYRRFLSRYGRGGFSGYEFYGVISEDFENSGIPDAIWLTLRHRKIEDLPKSIILISDMGDGGYYAIDISQKSADGDSPVVEWWPGAGSAKSNRRFVATDFGAFLLERIRWALESDD